MAHLSVVVLHISANLPKKKNQSLETIKAAEALEKLECKASKDQRGGWCCSISGWQNKKKSGLYLLQAFLAYDSSKTISIISEIVDRWIDKTIVSYHILNFYLFPFIDLAIWILMFFSFPKTIGLLIVNLTAPVLFLPRLILSQTKPARTL